MYPSVRFSRKNTVEESVVDFFPGILQSKMGANGAVRRVQISRGLHQVRHQDCLTQNKTSKLSRYFLLLHVYSFCFQNTLSQVQQAIFNPSPSEKFIRAAKYTGNEKKTLLPLLPSPIPPQFESEPDLPPLPGELDLERDPDLADPDLDRDLEGDLDGEREPDPTERERDLDLEADRGDLLRLLLLDRERADPAGEPLLLRVGLLLRLRLLLRLAAERGEPLLLLLRLLLLLALRDLDLDLEADLDPDLERDLLPAPSSSSSSPWVSLICSSSSSSSSSLISSSSPCGSRYFSRYLCILCSCLVGGRWRTTSLELDGAWPCLRRRLLSRTLYKRNRHVESCEGKQST